MGRKTLWIQSVDVGNKNLEVKSYESTLCVKKENWEVKDAASTLCVLSNEHWEVKFLHPSRVSRSTGK